ARFPRPVLGGAALVALAGVAAVGWWLRPVPPTPAPPPQPPAAGASELTDYQVRLKLKHDIDPQIRAADRMWMYVIEPSSDLPKSELKPPKEHAPGIREFSFRYFTPREGERFEADLVREVQTSSLATPIRTTVCVTHRPNVSAPLTAKLDCNEGERCEK